MVQRIKNQYIHNIALLLLFTIIAVVKPILYAKDIDNLNLTQEERNWLKTHPTISIIDDFVWPPYSYQDDEGKFAGIASSYTELFTKKLGIEFQPQFGHTWEEVLQTVKSRHGDIIPVLVSTPEREEYLSFTKPFISFPVVLATLQKSPFIDSLEDLTGKRVGVVKGYLSQKRLTEGFPNLQLVPYLNVAKGIEALNDGDIDAFAGNLGVISFEMKRLKVNNIKVAAPTPFVDELRFGSLKYWPELVSILDKALDSISNQEKVAIKNNWLGITVEFGTKISTILQWTLPTLLIIIAILTFILITNRRLTNEIMIRKKAEAAADNVSRTKSIFLANMSHEIRTPLNAIIGFLQILQETKVDEKQKNYLLKTSNSADTLLALLGDILDFSKVEAGKLDIDYAPFELQKVFKQTIDIFELEMKNKALTLSYEIDSCLSKFFLGDPKRIQQVLVNLISNAVKFTNDGSIHITLNILHQDTKKCTIDFSISDTGIGISEEDQLNIFDQFTQIDNSLTNKNAGTGLGLAISKQLVKAMGGVIYVESKLGEGSTFSFELSLDIAPELPSLQNLPLEQNLIFENLKILLVEDNLYNREVMHTVLSNMGIEVNEADNGKKALEMIRKQPYDMVFMDIQMPVMDGLSAMHIITEEGFTELPVIALSAYASKDEHLRSLDAGMLEHINKPFKFSEVKQLLLKYFPQKVSNVTKRDNIKNSCWVSEIEPIKGITIDNEMCNYWKDKETFLTHLARYIDSIKEDAKHLREMIDEDNITMAIKLLHKLKGSSKLYRTEKIFLTIEQLENSLDSMQLADIMKNLNNFDKAISELNN